MRALREKPSVFACQEEMVTELEIRNVSLRFGGLRALNEIDLNVSTGEMVAVIGPNGAGKTSLLNCITGYYKPQSGQIFFNNEDITHLPSHSMSKKGIGRTFQNIELFPGMTVLANLQLARHVYCKYSLWRALLFSKAAREEEVRHRQSLEDLIDFLELQSIRKQTVASLPYGLRKRVELGRALALEPRLLILDEPFAGMTLEEKEDMVRFLMEMNEAWDQTIILVEHDMSVVMSIAKRIAVLDYGNKISEGPPEDIKNDPEVIKAYLGDQETMTI